MDRVNTSDPAFFDWPSDSPAALTVLVVEDEPMIAIELLTLISERGGTALGPYGAIEAAKAAIANVHIDGAIVDLDLNGEMSFDVASLLEDAHVPFVIYTGIDSRLLPARHRHIPCLQKPCTGSDVVERLFAVMQ